MNNVISFAVTLVLLLLGIPFLIYLNKRRLSRTIKEEWNERTNTDQNSKYQQVIQWLESNRYDIITDEETLANINASLTDSDLFYNYNDGASIHLLAKINEGIYLGIVDLNYSFNLGYSPEKFGESQFFGFVNSTKELKSKAIPSIGKYFEINERLMLNFIRQQPIKCLIQNNLYKIKIEKEFEPSSIATFIELLKEMAPF